MFSVSLLSFRCALCIPLSNDNLRLMIDDVILLVVREPFIFIEKARHHEVQNENENGNRSCLYT